MRARTPDRDGHVEREGVKIFYEVFGDGEPTILLMPAWSVVHSRGWKMQVPFLARHYRVVTFDGRGNGRSDRPAGADSYLSAEYAADALAVMDATGTSGAVVVSHSRGASYALHLGAARPQRVMGQIFICPTTPLAPFSPPRLPFARRFEETLDSEDGWAKDNARYWERDYSGFLQFFFSQVFTEPHSTKPIEDGVMWGLETIPETLTDTRRGAIREANDKMTALLAGVQCPCLVIQGTDDAIVGPGAGPRLAEALGGRARLVELAGSGHAPHARDPVKVNLLIREFLEALEPAPTAAPKRWTCGRNRPKRALYISSPSGWAMPAGTRPSPMSCAGCFLAWRSTGWPSTRLPRSSRPRVNASIPPQRSWPVSRVTSSGKAPTMISTASRPGGRWMRSSWPTSWSSTTLPVKTLRPLDR